MKTLLWINSEEMSSFLANSKNISEIFISDIYLSQFDETKFTSVSKAMKKSKANKIIKIYDNFKFEILYKSNKVWTNLNFEESVLSWTKFNNYNISFNSEINVDFFKGKKKTEIKFENNNFIDFEKYFIDMLNFYLSEDWKNNVSDESWTLVRKISSKCSEEEFEKFKDKINEKKINEIDYKNFRQEENTIIFNANANNGQTIVDFSDGMVKVFSIYWGKEREKSFFSQKGSINNIVNQIKQNQVTTNKVNINKKKLSYSFIGIILFFVLSFITFKYIFTTNDMNSAFKIIFSGYSWRHQWIYLLFLNFFISLFLNMILGILIFKISDRKRKIQWKNYLNIFIGAQIRMTASFLTGNPYVATIIYSWYMVSVTKIRTSSLLGLTATFSMLTGILMIPIQMLFMIRGTIYANHLYQLFSNKNGYFITFFVFSWIGWIWNLIHNLSLALLIVFPPIHILISKYYMIKYNGENNVQNFMDKTSNFEMNIANLKVSSKSMFKNKARLYRISLALLITIILQTFEYTFSIRIVEDYYQYYNNSFDSFTFVHANYFNIFSISGIRLMSNYVHHVPLINVLPGQGMGITDITMNGLTKFIIFDKHQDLLTNNDSKTFLEDISLVSSFILRFFNFYLRRICALLITVLVVASLLFKTFKR